jgi:hypothetical protein
MRPQKGKKMTKARAIELREEWNQRVDRRPCQHRNQEIEFGEGGIVKITHHCLACGQAVLRIYKDTPVSNHSSD